MSPEFGLESLPLGLKRAEAGRSVAFDRRVPGRANRYNCLPRQENQACNGYCESLQHVKKYLEILEKCIHIEGLLRASPVSL